MNRYFLSVVFLGLGLVLSGCGQKSEETLPMDKNAEVILFYGRECPHCKVVEKYIEENKITEKISFVQSEVYHNKDNAAFLVEKAGKCGISGNSIGVPFLWAKDKCYVGQEEIIQFFKDETK